MLRLIALTILAVATASAGQIAYDGFAYAPGGLNGDNGGVGFATPWLADPGVAVVPPGLANPSALPSTGLEIGGGFQASRMLTNPLSQPVYPVYWASFEIQSSGGGNDQVWFGLDTVATSTPFLTFGRRLDNYFLSVQGLSSLTCCAASGPGVTDLQVVRLEQTGAFTNVDMWVNNLAAPPLLSTIMPTMTFNWVNLQVQPGLFADEVRLGTTAGDVAAVAGVPEPGTFAPIGFGLALAGWAMARRIARGVPRF